MKTAAFLLSLLLSTTASAQQTGAVDAYVREEMKKHLVPGLAYVIVDSSHPVQAGAFGKSGRGDAAMTTDTPMMAGSLSKMFTATAALQLVDQGRLELDTPVQRYLPWFRVADAAASKLITVRHLLNQTSGLPTLAPRAKGESPSLEDHVRALADAQLAAPPGSRHIYSSPNYLVVGLLIEKISGKSFADYLQEHIFRPLGMTRTFVDAELAQQAGLAAGHNIWFGVPLRSTYRHERDRLPTAGIITTARDLGRFASMHLAGGASGGVRILSPEMTAVSHKGAVSSGPFAYAMGWREGDTAGTPSLWHGGALPSYRGAVVLLPERNRAVIVLTNSSSMFADHTREIASGMTALITGAQPRPMYRPLRQAYTFIAVAAAVLLALQLRSIVRAARVARNAGRAVIGTTVVFDFGVPLLALLLVPRFTKISWKGMYEGAPDIVTVLAVLMVLAFVAGIVKLVTARSFRARSE